MFTVTLNKLNRNYRPQGDDWSKGATLVYIETYRFIGTTGGVLTLAHRAQILPPVSSVEVDLHYRRNTFKISRLIHC